MLFSGMEEGCHRKGFIHLIFLLHTLFTCFSLWFRCDDSPIQRETIPPCSDPPSPSQNTSDASIPFLLWIATLSWELMRGLRPFESLFLFCVVLRVCEVWGVRFLWLLWSDEKAQTCSELLWGKVVKSISDCGVKGYNDDNLFPTTWVVVRKHLAHSEVTLVLCVLWTGLMVCSVVFCEFVCLKTQYAYSIGVCDSSTPHCSFHLHFNGFLESNEQDGGDHANQFVWFHWSTTWRAS